MIKFNHGGDKMKIYKAYKFRLYPNKIQQELINKTLGSTRFIYNTMLYEKEKLYKENKMTKQKFDCIKELPLLKQTYPWLMEVDSMALSTTIFDLGNAFKNFHRTKNYPKYKDKYSKNSYRTNYIKNIYKNKVYENIKLDIINKTITLPKLKNMKIRGYRKTKEIKGRIINATISKEINRYYVSVLYEQEKEEKNIIPKTIVGIDLGVKDLVITSYGEKYENKKYITKYEKRIKNLQKWLSKKEKCSKNYYKIKNKIKETYKKLANARKYIIHKITKEIVNSNDLIITETLQTKKLIEKQEMSKYISDASLSEIIRQLEYKSKWQNKHFYQIDTYYPSSQICSHCNNKNKELKDLNKRKWTCSKCNNENDRDINAAINIMWEGLINNTKLFT